MRPSTLGVPRLLAWIHFLPASLPGLINRFVLTFLSIGSLLTRTFLTCVSTATRWIFDRLEDVRYRQALELSDMLHYPNPMTPWNPRRAKEIEFEVRAQLHEHGFGDMPTLLRRFLGKAFPGDTISYLSVDLITIFFWAAMAELADDLAWRSDALRWKAAYLRFPLHTLD
jgi:hypothetical protein